MIRKKTILIGIPLLILCIIGGKTYLLPKDSSLPKESQEVAQQPASPVSRQEFTEDIFDTGVANVIAKQEQEVLQENMLPQQEEKAPPQISPNTAIPPSPENTSTSRIPPQELADMILFIKQKKNLYEHPPEIAKKIEEYTTKKEETDLLSALSVLPKDPENPENPENTEDTEDMGDTKNPKNTEEVAPDISHIQQQLSQRRIALEEINNDIATDFTKKLSQEFGGDIALAKHVQEEGLVEPNSLYELFGEDSQYENQWSLPFVLQENLPSSHQKPSDSEQNIYVAIIDTGVDITHEDLKHQIWKSETCIDANGFQISGGCQKGGWDFVDNDNDPFPSDKHSHGTSVAGMIAATSNNDKGIASLGGKLSENGITIMSLRACCTTQGFFESQNIIDAIYFAVQNGANIINMSLGGPTYSKKMLHALEYAHKNNVLVVAAAGNYASNNDTKPIYPANYDLSNIISVGAVDSKGKLAYFSNYGKNTVDIAAPGAAVLTTGLNNSYVRQNGTSFAAPLVAGLLAVFLSQ